MSDNSLERVRHEERSPKRFSAEPVSSRAAAPLLVRPYATWIGMGSMPALVMNTLSSGQILSDERIQANRSFSSNGLLR
jgi:hypothetical protein